MTGMTIDECEAKRARLLTWYGAVFAVWAGALAALFLFVIDPGLGRPIYEPPTPSPAFVLVLVGLCAVGAVAFSFLLARLILLGRTTSRDPVLKEAASDERMRRNQMRAQTVGFWVLIASAALSIPLEVSGGIVLTAKTYALGLIWLGVTSVIFTFVLLERRDAA